MQVIIEEWEYKRLKSIADFMDSKDDCLIYKTTYYTGSSTHYVSSKSDIVNEYHKSLQETNERLRNQIDELRLKRDELDRIKSKWWCKLLIKLIKQSK